MKKLFFPVFLAFLLSALPAPSQLPAYLDSSKPMDERIEDALSRMTLEEKVALCHAQSKFSSPGVPRLGIPENWATDGPHGIRAEVFWDQWNQAGWTNDSCMAFPALTCLAAGWNPELSLLYGQSIGEEARYRNKNILLGPGVNIYRTPLNGRNFEYMGEDPFLASRMVAPYIQGVQSKGVAACVKHFALNNQEENRHTVDVAVDDRALYEIYLPAFKAAVQEGQAWSIMGAYNRYKGQWACHNQYLLNDILRGEWKFDGAVVSDWGGVTDTRQSIYNGLDMEFGTWTDGLTEGKSSAYDHYYLARPFLRLLQSGEVPVAEVDKKVRNILKLIFRTNMNPQRPWGAFVNEAHRAAGRKIAEEGIVLLQNKTGLLPVDTSTVKKIAVIGENAVKMMTVGGGSSSLKARYEILPIDGIRQRFAPQAEVLYARGYVGEAAAVQDGLQSAAISDHRSTAELLSEARELARQADLVIFVGGLNKSKYQDCEGADRRGLGLPYGQDTLIRELVKVNKNLVVVLISGNAVAMPWVNEVPAIVQSWYNGSEAGSALAAVLSGDVNPSGKLPFTFPVKLTDNGAHALGAYPGDSVVSYKESIFVGYRWMDQHKIKPLFSFGHGLSYTTFAYGKAEISQKTMTASDSLRVSLTLKNTGSRAGAEVVQLYIGDLKSSLPRPPKELKAFRKVYLRPGESATVTFTISRDALCFFDDKKHEWVAEPGDFEAYIGASSTDIRTKVKFSLL